MQIASAVVAVAAIITTIVLVVVLVGRDSCGDLVAPSFLSITRSDDEVWVRWYHPLANDGCDVTYTIEYSVDGGKLEKVSTAETSITVPRPNVCSTINFNLWVNNEAGDRSDTYATENYSEIPENVGVSNIEFLPTEAGIRVSWTRPSGVDNCIIDYRVEYYSDMTGVAEEDTSSLYIVIPACFRVVVNIYTNAFDQQITNSVRSLAFTDRVSGIDVQQSQENINEMIVTWNRHPTHDFCSLTYEVQNTLDGETNGDVTHTQDLTATFEAIFCSLFHVVVIAHSTTSDASSLSSVIERTLEPTRLGPVVNARVDFTGGNAATISWSPPELASQCINLFYTVNAINVDTSAEDVCTGQSMCTLSLNNFCSQTLFTVRESTGITEEASFYYNCA